MEGGQSGTYLRLTRASSGLRVSVAKTYRDETKRKLLFKARSQWLSSAVEYKRLTVSCILLLRKATVIWPKYSFSFCFHLYMSQQRSPAGRTTLSSVLVSAALSPFHIYKLVIQVYELLSSVVAVAVVPSCHDTMSKTIKQKNNRKEEGKKYSSSARQRETI